MISLKEKKLLNAIGGAQEFKNDEAINHVMKVALGVKHHQSGGDSCNDATNKNILAWTLQKYNANQKTIVKPLQGGRVVLPSEYFGKTSNKYVSNVKYTTMSDTSPTQVRPGLQSTGGGASHGHTISRKQMDELLQGGYFSASDKKNLLAQYNENIDKFVSFLKLRGGDIKYYNKIGKKDVNDAFRQLKKN